MIPMIEFVLLCLLGGLIGLATCWALLALADRRVARAERAWVDQMRRDVFGVHDDDERE